jgi:hypothetical protein
MISSSELLEARLKRLRELSLTKLDLRNNLGVSCVALDGDYQYKVDVNCASFR